MCINIFSYVNFFILYTVSELVRTRKNDPLLQKKL